jgi:predicted RNase H-like nuclease
MAGHPLPDGKRTWAGAEHRRMLLAREGLFVGDLGEAGRRAMVDDVLDAAAVAWTAARILTGDATSLPDPPEPTPDGLAAAIWV